MASTAKFAVSDYEHLKYRYGDENKNHFKESEDEDFLPFKSKSKRSTSSAHKQLIEKDFSSIEQVPIPSAWSPGMITKPNPSVFITPEKTDNFSKTLLSSGMGADKDNILEPRDLNKVPVPAAWSPHHNLRPSVFITPDRVEQDISKGDHTSKLDIQTGTGKSKEKLTVRFDLPSNSSGEECFNESTLSDSYSPITIRGNVIENNQVSENLKSSKTYNPMIYSDDSVLDDSYLEKRNKLGVVNNGVSLSTSANLVDKLHQILLNSEVTSEDTYFSESASSKSLNFLKSKNTLTDNAFSSASSSAILSQNSLSEQQVTSNNKLKSSYSKPKTKDCKKPTTKSKRLLKPGDTDSKDWKDDGTVHLNSSISQYYPPNFGACVIREGKHPFVSTAYSYPFETAESTEEYEHIFSRPEFNSTLKVRNEIDSLCDQDVDVQAVVEVRLAKSNTKRTEIQEKAAIFTNRNTDQFSNLVELEPAIDHLCDSVIQMRTSKIATQKKERKHLKKNLGQKEPDLMEFYSGDLQKEIPDFSLPGVSPSAPDLMSASPNQAFDGYRHLRMWNGLRDF